VDKKLIIHEVVSLPQEFNTSIHTNTIIIIIKKRVTFEMELTSELYFTAWLCDIRECHDKSSYRDDTIPRLPSMERSDLSYLGLE
jgi:hypothetical protein